jgi:hypothetical protein
VIEEKHDVIRELGRKLKKLLERRHNSYDTESRYWYVDSGVCLLFSFVEQSVQQLATGRTDDESGFESQ